MKATALFVAIVLAPALAGAQGTPWQVALVPPSNPVPVGMCLAVSLKITDRLTQQTPRNPQGYLIGMADFDMSVNGGVIAAGQYLDRSHFQVCGCQAGTGRSTATVTARYPSQSLPAAARVPGISIERTATFYIERLQGSANLPACLELAANAAAQSPPNQSPPANPSQPAGQSPWSTNAPTTPFAQAESRSTTPAATPNVAPSASQGTPLPITAPSTAAAAPPVNTPVPTASGRTPGAIAPATTPAAAPVTAPAIVPVNPSGLVAGESGANQVMLHWNPVSDASFYVVWGPGLTPGGHRVENQTQLINGAAKVFVVAQNVPAGTQEWMVASYYSPGNVSTPSAQYSRATVNVTAPAAASTSTAAPVAAQTLAGKYLVTITGVRVYQASMDDVLSRDGMGDEVYAAAYVRRYDRNTSQLADASIRQSAVYGDVNKFETQRLQAGSRSQTGGLQDGDMIPGPALIAMRSVAAQDVTFPLRLWEGTLTDGVDALVISPSLWEQDSADNVYGQWLQFQQTINISLFAKQGVQDQISQRLFGSMVFGMSGGPADTTGQSIQRLVVDAGMMLGGVGVPLLNILATSADRPLGLVQNGRDQTALPNHTVVLTREIIEAALAKPPLGSIPSPLANAQGGNGGALGTAPLARLGVVAPKPGIIVVHFQEKDVSGTMLFPERPAIYQMYIQVEKIP